MAGTGKPLWNIQGTVRSGLSVMVYLFTEGRCGTVKREVATWKYTISAGVAVNMIHTFPQCFILFRFSPL